MVQPLKILMMSHSSELDGAERSMIDLLSYWANQGLIKPHIIIRRPLGPMASVLRSKGLSYTALSYGAWAQRHRERRKYADKFRGTLINSRAIFKIEKLIQELQPDVVMTNTIISPWAAIAAHLQGLPHVWFVREYGYLDHQAFFETGRDETFRDIGTLSDLVVTNSKTLAEYLSRYIPQKKIVPLYNPFNLDEIHHLAKVKVKNPFKDQKSLKLVITGRIAQSKGQFATAEAVGQLNQSGYQTELCIIGEPSDSEDEVSLKQAIAKYKIADKVHLLGRQSNPLAYVSLADVGIMASTNEAFGRVTFEYMAIGKPVVGANSGATPELIESGLNGFLYSSGSVNSMVSQLKKYASDSGLIEKHGRVAANRAHEMMHGEHNAKALFKQVVAVVNKQESRGPYLFFSRKWLEYPILADKYIAESGVLTLRHQLYIRLRGNAKGVYVKLRDISKDRAKK